jgi:acyl dehydratase
MRVIKDFADLSHMVNTAETITTEWEVVSQERIQLFADATGDHQWIHLDTARAAKESPYGTTIAHGFLTLSLLAGMVQKNFDTSSLGGMSINYGLNKVRFTAAVRSGSKVRARLTPISAEAIESGGRQGTQTVFRVEMECEGQSKPVMVAESVNRRYVV